MTMMDNKLDLRACPHCSLPDIIVERRPRAGWYCVCSSCLSQGPTNATKDDAITSWNRRSSDEQAEVVGALERGEVLPKLANCGHYLAEDNTGQWHYINHANTWQPYPGPTTPEALAMAYASPPAVAAGGVTEAITRYVALFTEDEIFSDCIEAVERSLSDEPLIAAKAVAAINALRPTPPSRGEGE